MKSKRLRNITITIFVIVWTFIFHYESTRYFYLNKVFKKELGKLPLLFPPAGWPMFYTVGDNPSYMEIYGVSNERPQIIDHHLIFETRTIGYDNIHRNIMVTVAPRSRKVRFCALLERKFPEFDNFLITAVYYPSVSREPNLQVRQILYECQE